jgi:hypothetical protein
MKFPHKTKFVNQISEKQNYDATDKLKKNNNNNNKKIK